MPTHPTAGRSLVARRAIVDLIRSATLGSYGVTGFSARPHERVLGRLGLVRPGIAVRLGEDIDLELDLTIAFGTPVAEVARQVDSAVRFALRRALGREVRHVTIRVDGLRVRPGGPPPSGRSAR